MANFLFTGKLRMVKDGYTEQEFSGGLIKKRLRAQMICGDSTQYIEATALVWKDAHKNVIRTYKKVDGGKDAKLDVQWSDRFDPEIVDSVAGYRRWLIDTDTFGHRKELEEAGLDEELAKSKKKKKEFIHAADFVDYLKKVLENEKSKDMVFKVSGNVEFSYSANKDMFYRNFVPQKIYRVNDDAEQSCQGSMKLYFTEGAIDDTMVDETGDYIINACTMYYDSNIKANAFTPMMFKINKSHPKAKGFKMLFSKASGDEVKELGATVDFINGATRVAITEDMLSDEQRELLELGMTTMEEISAEMGGSVYGDRVTETRLTGLMKGYSSGVQDTVYTSEQIMRKPIKEEEPVDLFSGDEDDDEDGI